MGLASVAAVPLGLLFLLSGLIFNAVEFLLVVTVLPLSRSTYRRLNAVLAGSYWSQLVWLVEWWGCLKIVVFTEPETWAMMGKENSLVICNHRSDVDWAVGWTLAQRTGCLGTTRALMKKIVQYLPVIGWSMWMSEYIFLARDWKKDEAIMKEGYGRFRDFPLPFWVALFVEGTRFTPQKLKMAQEFAQAQGIPVPKNTLVPRTKGFVLTVECLRDFVPSIVDITVMVPEGQPNPTFGGFFERKRSEMHVHLRRVPMSDLPRDAEGISNWCKDTFMAKDAMLEEHKKINSFDPKLLLPMEPSKWTIFHTAFWSSLVVGGIAWVVAHHTGAFTLTWQTAAVAGVVVLGFAGVLQLLIHFTKSEYSTPMKSSAKPKPREDQQTLLPEGTSSDRPSGQGSQLQ